MHIKPDQLLTTHEIGALLQMDPSTVVCWANAGKLEVYRTPGKHRRVRAGLLVEFLRRHSMYVPPALDPRTQVLVVSEDESMLKALARSAKSQETLAISTCANPIQALVRIGSEPPDVVVLDVAMRRVDVLAVLERLKRNAETKNIEVVIAAGKASAALEKKAAAMGARVIAKPVDANGLAEMTPA